MRVATCLLLSLVCLSPAWGQDAVFAARVPADADLEGTLEAYDDVRVHYRRGSPRETLAVFVATDREPTAGVQRLTALGERELSLYRVQTTIRYGALPLPPAAPCPEFDRDAPLGIEEVGEVLGRSACMNRLVRESLVKATTQEAVRSVEAEFQRVRAMFGSVDGDGPEPIVVARQLETFLVTTPTGERQEAEAEALIVALTWREPFRAEAVPPVAQLTIQRLVALPGRPATETLAAPTGQGMADVVESRAE